MNPHDPARLSYGLEPLDVEVLLALALDEESPLPITHDGRFARAAFGRDLDLDILGPTPNGVQARERTSGAIAADGAPDVAVYAALVVAGLARESLGRCAWAITPAGRELAGVV